MRIVVTGASGFLGRLLAGTLSRAGSFGGRPIDRLVLVDRVAPSGAPKTDDARTETVRGDLVEHLGGVFAEPVDVLFHLAAAVSAECEADFDLGMRANVDVTRALLEAARAQSAAGGPVTRVVFASSLAVYGAHPGLPLPPVVSETTVPVPRSSYGTQKLMCEQLIADCTRRGFVDGRVARLMTVTVRPGRPTPPPPASCPASSVSHWRGCRPSARWTRALKSPSPRRAVPSRESSASPKPSAVAVRAD